MGVGGALMWPAILGMTYEILPEEKAGLAGGVIIGAAGLGNAIGPADRRRLHRPPQLALDLLPNVPVAIFAVLVTYRFVHVKEPEAGEQKIDYAGDRGDLGRPRLAADRARPGRRLGLGRPEDHRAVGARAWS